MAECVRQHISGEGHYRGENSATWKYLYKADSETLTNPLAVISQAQATGPNPLPAYGANLAGSNLYAHRFPVDQTKERKDSFLIDCIFEPPEKGEDDEQQEEENPLLRPAVYDIQHIEQEYVVEQAYNVESLGSAFLNTPERPPDTLGPIVNAAFRRPDEPIVDTERNCVVVIQKNYPSLAAILALNEEFQRTTNSDTCNVGGQSISPRRLKYLVTRSSGKQVENGITFYPGVTEIELKKTTDLKLDNVGYEHYSTTANSYVRATEEDEPTADPVNLTLTGERAADTDDVTTITYYYLQEVAYSGFF